MKSIRINYKGAAYEAFVDDEDYALAMAAGPWRILWKDGSVRAVQADWRWDGGRTTVFLHRLVMGLVPGDPDVDHIDRNPLNCQKGNLRLAEQKFNQQNRSPRGNKNGASSYRGVSFYRRTGKWTAQQHMGGRKFHLGYFDTAEEANEAAIAWRAANYTHSGT